jgi:uncharacterized protein HemX
MIVILKWLKIAGYLLIAIGGAVVVLYLIQKKNKDKAQIDAQIEQINQIKVKTAEDMAELNRLQEEKKKIEEGIQNTNNTFLQKAKDLMANKEPDKPGDAGKASDGLTDAWPGGKK